MTHLLAGLLAGLSWLPATAVLAQPAPQPHGSRAASLEAPPPMAGSAAMPARAGSGTAVPLPDAHASEPADLPPARVVSREARIDQRRQGNRIVELTVTPAGTTHSYVIVNREGQRPLSVQELSAGLSTPRFFRLEF